MLADKARVQQERLAAQIRKARRKQQGNADLFSSAVLQGDSAGLLGNQELCSCEARKCAPPEGTQHLVVPPLCCVHSLSLLQEQEQLMRGKEKADLPPGL